MPRTSNFFSGVTGTTTQLAFYMALLKFLFVQTPLYCCVVGTEKWTPASAPKMAKRLAFQETSWGPMENPPKMVWEIQTP